MSKISSLQHKVTHQLYVHPRTKKTLYFPSLAAAERYRHNVQQPSSWAVVENKPKKGSVVSVEPWNLGREE